MCNTQKRNHMRAMSGFFSFHIFFSLLKFYTTSWIACKREVFSISIRGIENKLRIFIHIWWRCAIKKSFPFIMNIHNVSLFVFCLFVEKNICFFGIKAFQSIYRQNENTFFCLVADCYKSYVHLKNKISTPCCSLLWIFHSWISHCCSFITLNEIKKQIKDNYL